MWYWNKNVSAKYRFGRNYSIPCPEVDITDSSTTVVSIFHTTRRQISQNGDLNIHHHENVKSHRLGPCLSRNENSSLVTFTICGLVATIVIIFCTCYKYDEPWPHYSTTLKHYMYRCTGSSDCELCQFLISEWKAHSCKYSSNWFPSGGFRSIDKGLLLYHTASFLSWNILINVNWRTATPRCQ